jgi:hypothetical protein
MSENFSGPPPARKADWPRPPGRDVKADSRSHTPGLRHASDLADQYGDTRTSDQVRKISPRPSDRFGRLPTPPRSTKRARKGR